MSTAIYIVIYAREFWWVDLDGESEGPFATMERAMAAAMEMAEETSARGGRSEVRVAGPGHSNELVYQSAQRSLLSRTVAEAYAAA